MQSAVYIFSALECPVAFINERRGLRSTRLIKSIKHCSKDNKEIEMLFTAVSLVHRKHLMDTYCMCEVKVAFHRAASLTMNHFSIINPDALGNISISCTCSLCSMSRSRAKCETPLPARITQWGDIEYQQQHNFHEKKANSIKLQLEYGSCCKKCFDSKVWNCPGLNLGHDREITLRCCCCCCCCFLSYTCAEVINPFVDTVGKLDRLTTLFKE